MRITPAEIKHVVEILQNRGADIAVHWAYGKPRITTRDQSRDLSPRAPTGQIYLWLDGFEQGMEAHCKFCR